METIDTKQMGLMAQEIAEGVLSEAYKRLGVDTEKATGPELLAVLHLALLTTATLEGILKTGMAKEERLNVRIFLDQFSDHIERRLSAKHNPTPHN